MTPFLLIAVAMVALALAWVLVPLLRHGTPGVGREISNIAILRDQLRELDADLATGTMPRDRYEQAKRELEERALEESREVRGAAAAPSQSAAWTAAIIAGAIPIAALLLYVALGNPDGIGPAARAAKGGAEHEVTRAEVEAMAEKLAARLQKEPDNADGWVMLARTYYALNRHADAARAFDRAVAIIPDNADLLADYADALGATEGGLKGKSQELIERALKADPTHWKALALAGTAAFNNKDYKLAVVVLGADEGDRSAGLADCGIDRRQHRRGATAGRARSRSGTGHAFPGECATASALRRRKLRRSLPRRPRLPRPAHRSAAR